MFGGLDKIDEGEELVLLSQFNDRCKDGYYSSSELEKTKQEVMPDIAVGVVIYVKKSRSDKNADKS